MTFISFYFTYVITIIFVTIMTFYLNFDYLCHKLILHHYLDFLCHN